MGFMERILFLYEAFFWIKTYVTKPNYFPQIYFEILGYLDEE